MDKVRELAQLMAEYGLVEATVEDGDGCISLRMASPASGVAEPVPAVINEAVSTEVETNDSVSSSENASEKPDSWFLVTAPMVGTFYASSAPGEEPFVSEGDVVETGQTLCIVEAMKLMNEVESPKAGVVREICVSDAEAVEFDAPLFWIEPR